MNGIAVPLERLARMDGHSMDTGQTHSVAVQLAALTGELRGYREGTEHRLHRLETDVAELTDDVMQLARADSRRLGHGAGIAVAAAVGATFLGYAIQLMG